jgi:hypothetical protein
MNAIARIQRAVSFPFHLLEIKQRRRLSYVAVFKKGPQGPDLGKTR